MPRIYGWVHAIDVFVFVSSSCFSILVGLSFLARGDRQFCASGFCLLSSAVPAIVGCLLDSRGLGKGLPGTKKGGLRCVIVCMKIKSDTLKLFLFKAVHSEMIYYLDHGCFSAWVVK